jgi:hypothetical protein
MSWDQLMSCHSVQKVQKGLLKQYLTQKADWDNELLKDMGTQRIIDQMDMK